MGNDSLLTTRDTAQYLAVKLPRIYDLVRSGKLRAVRVGRQLRFKRQDIDDFVNRNGTQRH